MLYRISKEDRTLKGEVSLVSSKSESNRVLLIKQLCSESFNIHNLSDADDTKVMLEAMSLLENYSDTKQTLEINVQSAGTVMRLLTSYLAMKPGTFVLTGTERMKQRPIGILVNALKKLGANIEYLEKTGFPPIKISGQPLKSRIVDIEANVSSQFITALMLIAPTLQEGLTLNLRSNIVSKPYIEMTLKIMKHFGVMVKWQGDEITIPPQRYKAKDFRVGADWTSASYIYECAALAEQADVFIRGLLKNKIQGDIIVAKLFRPFGIQTIFTDDGVRLVKKKIKHPRSLQLDFTNFPDLAQSLAVTCAGLNVETTFTGLETLNIKETERLNAMRSELSKMKFNVEIVQRSIFRILPSNTPRNFKEPVQTYNDHRMAMSFAPLALLFPEISIENPFTVSKSYPGYWEDLKRLGFEIK